MLHSEYERLRSVLLVGLRAAGLERSVEIDGPNRLGGFRLSDGENRVALSFAPPRKKEDREAKRHWWVSAWIPVSDIYDSLLASDLIPVPHRREVLMKKPLDACDAVIAAVQLLTELRVRAALSRMGSATTSASTTESTEKTEEFILPSLPAPLPQAGPVLGDTVFGTAPNRAGDRDASPR